MKRNALLWLLLGIGLWAQDVPSEAKAFWRDEVRAGERRVLGGSPAWLSGKLMLCPAGSWAPEDIACLGMVLMYESVDCPRHSCQSRRSSLLPDDGWKLDPPRFHKIAPSALPSLLAEHGLQIPMNYKIWKTGEMMVMNCTDPSSAHCEGQVFVHTETVLGRRVINHTCSVRVDADSVRVFSETVDALTFWRIVRCSSCMWRVAKESRDWMSEASSVYMRGISS